MISSDLTGKALRDWRKALNWSQSFAAERLGVCIASYRSYESQKRSDKESPVEVPMLVSWACAAIQAGLNPYTGKLKK
jgi:transcriptional regulator with XRE-family HTH domain